MTKWDILLWTLSHRNTVYQRRVEENLLHSTFTKLHNVTYIYMSNCFLAWSAFVWYAIKIDIRPRPVSIFSDYSAIKEYIYVMLRKQTWKWQHQTSRQSLHLWEFCTRLWSCFSDSLKIVFFQTQQFCFLIHSQVTFNHWQTGQRTTNEEVLHGHSTGFCQTLSKLRITYEIST